MLRHPQLRRHLKIPTSGAFGMAGLQQSPPSWFDRRCGGDGSGSSGDVGGIGGGSNGGIGAAGAAAAAGGDGGRHDARERCARQPSPARRTSWGQTGGGKKKKKNRMKKSAGGGGGGPGSSGSGGIDVGAAEDGSGDGDASGTEGTNRRVNPEEWLAMTKRQQKNWRRRGGKFG